MRVCSNQAGRLALLALLATAGTFSCSGGTDSNDEPRIEEMRLQIGGQQVIVTHLGAVIGDAIVLRIGTPTTLTAVFTDEFGVPTARVVSGDFRLDVTVLTSSVATYTPSTTNTLSGMIAATAVSSGSSLRFSLYHISRQHIDWGPYDVTIITSN